MSLSKSSKSSKSSVTVDLTAKINKAIDADKTYRRKGVTDGIRVLGTLRPATDIPQTSFPIIRPFRNQLQGGAITDEKLFKKLFYEKWTALRGFDLQAHGIICAGSAVSSIVLNTGGLPRDCDLFLIHENDGEAIFAICALLIHLSKKEWSSATVFRTKACITVLLQKGERQQQIQIILRKYCSISEVIHGFDLGSSALAFDGQDVWLTECGALAVEHRLNILNMDVRRRTYERRLMKYFNHHKIGIVLPRLDLRKVREEGIEMKFISFAYVQCNGSNLVANFAYIHRRRESDEGNEGNDTYDAGFDYNRIGEISMQNVKSATCLSAPLKPDMNLMDMPLVMHKESVHMTIRFCAEPTSMRVNQLVYLLGETVAMEIIKFAMQPHTKEELDEFIRVRVDAQIQQVDPVIPIRLMEVEEGTSLTGPFLREVVSEAEWYDSYFRE